MDSKSLDDTLKNAYLAALFNFFTYVRMVRKDDYSVESLEAFLNYPESRELDPQSNSAQAVQIFNDLLSSGARSKEDIVEDTRAFVAKARATRAARNSGCLSAIALVTTLSALTLAGVQLF